MDARLSLVVAALLLAPLAAADHVFSHRLYVVGRVVDSEGTPAPALPVNVTFEGVGVTGRCFDSRDEVTGPQGDYEICRHVHQIPADATATVRVGGAERTVGVDPDLRHASASLQLDAPVEARDIHGERAFARTFLVTGRVFELLPRPAEEEGIEVLARPVGENATVSLRVDGRTIANATAKPDEHGTYRAELAVEEVPPGALVRVVVGRDGAEILASPLFRRADVNVVRDQRLLYGPGEDAPGVTTPAGAWVAAGALALAAAAWTLRSPARK